VKSPTERGRAAVKPKQLPPPLIMMAMLLLEVLVDVSTRRSVEISIRLGIAFD